MEFHTDVLLPCVLPKGNTGMPRPICVLSKGDDGMLGQT